MLSAYLFCQFYSSLFEACFWWRIDVSFLHKLLDSLVSPSPLNRASFKSVIWISYREEGSIYFESRLDVFKYLWVMWRGWGDLKEQARSVCLHLTPIGGLPVPEASCSACLFRMWRLPKISFLCSCRLYALWRLLPIRRRTCHSSFLWLNLGPPAWVILRSACVSAHSMVHRYVIYFIRHIGFQP